MAPTPARSPSPPSLFTSLSLINPRMNHLSPVARFGPHTPPGPVTVQSILAMHLVASSDPFTVLLISLQGDLYEHHQALRTAGKVFTGILSLSVLNS